MNPVFLDSQAAVGRKPCGAEDAKFRSDPFSHDLLDGVEVKIPPCGRKRDRGGAPQNTLLFQVERLVQWPVKNSVMSGAVADWPGNLSTPLAAMIKRSVL